MQQKYQKIKNVITHSFIISAIIIFFVAMVIGLVLNQHQIKLMRESNLQKTHEILERLLIPSLTISDSGQVIRQLSLSSDNNQFFVVLDKSENILAPNYNGIILAQTYFKEVKKAFCNDHKTLNQKINGENYWVKCTKLITKDLTMPDNSVGLLVSFSKNILMPSFSFIIYFSTIAVVILLCISFWFRGFLHRRLLNPLVQLSNYIATKERNFLVDQPDNIVHFSNSPHEVRIIKDTFEKLLANLQQEYTKRTEFEKKSALFDLAAQVAHDLKSPLAVMEISLASITTQIRVSQTNQIMQAIQTVRDIAHNLLSRYRSQENLIEPHDIFRKDRFDNGNVMRTTLAFSLIETVVSQKRQEWSTNPCEINYNVSEDAKIAWVNVAPNKVKSIISNLLNNAYEALDTKRNIQISLEVVAKNLRIKILDYGIGIEADRIEPILNGTSSKHPGKGLGLSTAKKYVEEIGGKLTIASKMNLGTKISIFFPLRKKPNWLPDVISLYNSKLLIVIDDDASIHTFWQNLLNNLQIKAFYFTCLEAAQKWIDQESVNVDDSIFFVDFEIHDASKSGIDFLVSNKLQKNAYLITSHADEVWLQKQINSLNIWLVPKSLLAYYAATLEVLS